MLVFVALTSRLIVNMLESVVALLFTWRVTVIDCWTIASLGKSTVGVRIVESCPAEGFRSASPSTIPLGSLAKTIKIRFFAPKNLVEVKEAEKRPSEALVGITPLYARI